MKLFVIILITLVLLLCIYFVLLSATADTPERGLHNGALRPCSSKPNCVTSEGGGANSANQEITPIAFPDPRKWDSVSTIVTAHGGIVVQQENHYLAAEYRSRIFRFVDDLEIRFDEANKQLQVKSASRSGTSDLGVNRKRVEALRELIATMAQ
ncbi:MAG: DUF1499 domain-containing protein [Gammaproteobacteria bacterium]|nr:DUF1499 domain-containing protein [Gammaproteobacteria bacterium]